MEKPRFSHGLSLGLSLIKLEINPIQLTLQIRLYKFLKYVFLHLFSLNLGSRGLLKSRNRSSSSIILRNLANTFLKTFLWDIQMKV